MLRKVPSPESRTKAPPAGLYENGMKVNVRFYSERGCFERPIHVTEFWELNNNSKLSKKNFTENKWRVFKLSVKKKSLKIH